ncbi:MAG: helix-turn-helix domain-containing protein [Anaerolineae bacterium]
MSDSTPVTLQALLQFALPLGTSLVSGAPDASVTYAVTVRAQPPAFPELYGGELALVSMDVLHTFDSRITLAEVVRALAQAGVAAVAAQGTITGASIETAVECNVALLSLPDDTSLTRVERAVNTLIINQKAQMAQRAMEIQRQLTRQAAENRDLNSLLQILSRATAKPVAVHDDAGMLMAQVYPSVARRVSTAGRGTGQSLPYGAFQNWMAREAPVQDGAIVRSPLGFTTVLKVEKRVAGYLSLVDSDSELEEFDRLVLAYGADVCAIELAKLKAIAYAVEQARGDWVQMWLSGGPGEDDLILARAQQAGFDPATPYLVAVFRAMTPQSVSIPLDSMLALVRDDLARRQIAGAAGSHVDVLVVLYPADPGVAPARVRRTVDELRAALATRTAGGLVSAGLSHPAVGLAALRESYREARDAVSIAQELGNREHTTFYGDLKLYQLLLAVKDRNLEQLRRFYHDTMGPLVEHDGRKGGELSRTLSGFFEANGNMAKAAADLDVHRNTLVYRLERISDLTGLDLDDPDNRLVLHLALKVQRVLASMHGP